MVVNAEVQWQLTRAAERQAELNATAPLPAAGPSRSPTAVRGALRRARSAGPIPRVANLSPSRQVPSFASVVNDVLAARAAFQKPTPALAPKPPMDKSSALWLRGTAAIRIGRLRERLKKVELENRMLKARIDADQEAEKASVAASDAAKLAREALAKRSLERQKEREQAAARARARQEEEVAAAAEQPAAPSKKTEEMWTLETWLESMPLPQIVSRSLLKHLSPDGPPEPGLEQAFVDSLGSTSDLPTFLALLRDAMVLEEIADTLFGSAKKLSVRKAAARKRQLAEEKKRRRAARGEGEEGEESAESSESEDEDEKMAAFKAKFVSDGAFELVLGDLGTFFGGLKGLVGLPAGFELPMMRKEHTQRPDSHTTFEAPNYGTTTTSASEFAFVADGKAAARETRIESEKLRRRNLPPSAFEEARARVDEKLTSENSPPLSDSELVAARLYTGCAAL